MADFNLNVSASELNSAIAKANAAAPQSTTYTKAQVDTAIAAETAARQAADTAMQPFLSGKKVYEHYFGSTSGSDTFTVAATDFGSGDLSKCGVYLIYRISWATAPAISIYALAYSGNHTDYTALQKIAGDDFDISVAQDVLSFTTAGKIQIIAIA